MNNDEGEIDMKAGWKTTEFLITLALTLLGSLLAADVIPAGSVWARVGGAILATGAAMGYSISRGLAKRNPRNGP